MKAVGSPGGRATPKASRSRAASSAAAMRSSPAIDTRMARRSATSWSTHASAGPAARPPSRRAGRATDVDLPQRQRAEHPQQVVDLVGVAGPATVDQPLQLELEVGQHARVDQLAQLLGPEQVAQQVAVERQRRRPALGQRRVALVHVDADPAEQQRLGERGRPWRLDRHHAHPAGPQVGQHLAQGGQVEHVVDALAGGLEQDREVGMVGGHGQQIGRLLALLPQRRAPIGSAPGQQQGPGRALAEPRREHGRLRELGHHHRLDLVGVDGQLVERELVDGLGQAQHDAVVAPHELDVDAPPLGQPGLQGHAPRRVHLRPERAQHAHPPVADLVAEALDHDGAVVGNQAAAGLGLLVEVGHQVARRPADRGRCRDWSRSSEPAPSARTSRTNWPRAWPSSRGGRARRRARTASCRAGRAPG